MGKPAKVHVPIRPVGKPVKVHVPFRFGGERFVSPFGGVRLGAPWSGTGVGPTILGSVSAGQGLFFRIRHGWARYLICYDDNRNHGPRRSRTQSS